jgi:fluoroacetyl-CoA thioesterase
MRAISSRYSVDPRAPEPLAADTPETHNREHVTTYTASFRVGEGDTAVAVGSGDLAVLATPRLIAWCEAATVALATQIVQSGRSTVGTRVECSHERASPVGALVYATARLVERDGRRLVFEVVAEHDLGEGRVAIGHGRITRVDVDPEAFMARLPLPGTRM